MQHQVLHGLRHAVTNDDAIEALRALASAYPSDDEIVAALDACVERIEAISQHERNQDADELAHEAKVRPGSVHRFLVRAL